MTRLVTVITLLLLPGLAHAQATRPTGGAATQPITTVEALHRLPPGQAARQRPVKLRGIVTYLSATPQMMFVQSEDGSGAFTVAGPRDRDARQLLKVGVS